MTALVLGSSNTEAVTGTAVDMFENTGNGSVLVRYAANISTHISLIGDATTTDAYVFAGIPEIINVDPGKTLSAIKATGEADGDGWATLVTCA